MHDPVSAVGPPVASDSRPSSSLPYEPLNIDPWVTSSLLQKAIRRGEADLAERAAIRLFRLRGKGVWRRFLVIAFEDVGVGSVQSLVNTTTAATDAEARSRVGGDDRAVSFIARLLAEAPKDRSADHLIGAAWSHPAFGEARRVIGEQSLAWRLDLVADMDLPLPTRAIALFGKLSARWSGKEGAHDLHAAARMFLNLGVPPDLLKAAREAAILTREPIVAVAPLLWLAASQDPARSIVDCAVPDTPAIDGVPLYAFDKHTAIGKAAIHRLARESPAVRDVLAAFVEDDRARDVAAMAAFYADAAPVSRRFAWDGSAALEALGVESDMLRAGAPLAGIEPILGVLRENLGYLNAIRARLFFKRRSGG